MSITPPNVDTKTSSPLQQGPEDYADLANGLAKVIAQALQKSENMLPVKVISYDRAKNTAVVHPLIKIITTGNTYSRAQIGPIPVFAFGGGNFVINFPLKAGDLGWILANDRDITGFQTTLSESTPTTYRTHDFNDSVLFPDVIRNFQTSGEDGNMVIQSLDGTQKISIGANQIHIVHPTLLTVDAPNSQFNGNITATGTITGQTDVVFAGVSGKNHLHDGHGTLLDGSGKNVTGSTSKPHN
jgi:hypothetical protein